MNRRADPRIAGLHEASRSPTADFQTGAAIGLRLPLPFRCDPDTGARRTGKHPVRGSARP